jgi:hypothetical protein
MPRRATFYGIVIGCTARTTRRISTRVVQRRSGSEYRLFVLAAWGPRRAAARPRALPEGPRRPRGTHDRLAQRSQSGPRASTRRRRASRPTCRRTRCEHVTAADKQAFGPQPRGGRAPSPGLRAGYLLPAQSGTAGLGADRPVWTSERVRAWRISRYAFSLGEDADSVARSARLPRSDGCLRAICGRRVGRPVRVSRRVRLRAVWCCVRSG